ncbi:MAG: hypothetical protein KKB51_17635 [Candidatus Riflebacteria bacterium]|nr:hypothetical protein [Candidatus Riflebacteria bacterium]
MRKNRLELCFCLVVALLVAVSSLASGNGEPSFNELRVLLSQAESLARSLTPGVKTISPDQGRFLAEYDEVLNKIEFARTSLFREIELRLDKGDFSLVDDYIQFIESLPENDPARSQLLPFSKVLRSKLVFQGITNKAIPAAAMAERQEFLENNHGTLSLAKGNSGKKRNRNQVPIYITFQWHMHQPIYWPYENIVTTEGRNVYSFSLFEVFFSRSGAYTSWPFNAVNSMHAAGLDHGGAQVSFSGSLIENLNNINGGSGGFNAWKDQYTAGRHLKTKLGNPRLDMVAFGYHHPLMALIGYEDIRRQIDAHKKILLETFGKDVPYSKGIFPPENAFSSWMIPALVDSDLQWVMVDNIHFNRACKGYPWVKGENLYPPNPADQVNPAPQQWLQLNGLWAPSKVSAWGVRPHWVEATDPKTGTTAVTPDGKKARMIAVPTERYLGNEDGRGGFGALNYEMVMSQFQKYNTDSKHPILLVLHHDGDNYGGGTESYYHSNFSRFVEWVQANPDRFVATTIQDYLDQFPPAENDVIHVEPGSWSGADNGDPEFLKWNGHPDKLTGYSPDRNSWGVMTACRNIVATARDQKVPVQALREGERMLMVSQTSCYEYWDGTEMWDSHPTRACNDAFKAILPYLSNQVRDVTPPAIYIPQRRPYNPGGMEWGAQPEPQDFTIWTYAYDFGDLKSVDLCVRVTPNKRSPDQKNRTVGAGEWQIVAMQAVDIPAQTNPKPVLKASEFSAVVKGKADSLVDYYVSAVDKAGNKVESPIMHVYVGTGKPTDNQSAGLTFTPAAPKKSDTLVFTSDRPGKLHWGVNSWKLPSSKLWPESTVIWPDNKAVETPMQKTSAGKYQLSVGPFTDTVPEVTSIEAVMHFDDNSWGKDVSIKVD